VGCQAARQQNERDDDQADESADEEAEGEGKTILAPAKILDERDEAFVPPRVPGFVQNGRRVSQVRLRESSTARDGRRLR
jgi:hypothetical protein